MPGLGGAVPDPGHAGDLRHPLLSRAVQRERGLQQPPLQLPALLPDHLLPRSPWSRNPASPAAHDSSPANCSAGSASAAARSRVRRDLAPVLPDLHHRHREPHRHSPTSECPPGMISGHHPGNGPEPADPSAPDRPGYAPGSPPAPLPTSADHSRQRQKYPESPGHSEYRGIQSCIGTRSHLLKRCTHPRGPSGTGERPGPGRAAALASHIRCFFGGYYFCRLLHLMRIRDGMRTVAALDSNHRADQCEVSGGAYVDDSG